MSEEKFKKLIEDGKPEIAIDQLIQLTKNTDKGNHARILKGRLTQLKEYRNHGAISPIDYDVARNLIYKAILEFVDELTDSGILTKHKPPPPTSSNGDGCYHIFITLGIIMGIMWWKGCLRNPFTTSIPTKPPAEMTTIILDAPRYIRDNEGFENKIVGLLDSGTAYQLYGFGKEDKINSMEGIWRYIYVKDSAQYYWIFIEK
jgi:hypothetical protein